jgi:hypothetical protein
MNSRRMNCLSRKAGALFYFSDGVSGSWPEVHVVVTDHLLAWAMIQQPDAGAPTMRFARMVKADEGESGNQVLLMNADLEYTGSLNDPTKPHGETVVIFDFGSQPESRGLKELILRKARERS